MTKGVLHKILNAKKGTSNLTPRTSLVYDNLEKLPASYHLLGIKFIGSLMKVIHRIIISTMNLKLGKHLVFLTVRRLFVYSLVDRMFGKNTSTVK